MESSPCVDIADEDRQIYCGMMRCIDTSVEGMMAAVSDIGQYDNTLFVASGDNGGAPKNGGYNYPLRGSKGTLFEGGIRQNSWIWGAMLPSSVVRTCSPRRTPPSTRRTSRNDNIPEQVGGLCV